MDNKLSELSKPVAQAYYDEYDSSTMLIDWLVDSVPDAPAALYSQEYVSALDKVAQYWIGESAGWKKRAEDAEKRIAELEEEFSFIMGQNDGMEKELRDKDARIEHLEAKLATPVRLPNKNDDEFWFDNVFQVAKFDRAVERAIRAAGFTVEGDE